jgi:hypothetical protein
MATSRNILCGICEAHHITNYADQFCPECDEGLCSECENHHKVSKSSRNHGVICSILSINVDVLDVLIISRIDKSPTQSLWCVEIQSGVMRVDAPNVRTITKFQSLLEIMALFLLFL